MGITFNLSGRGRLVPEGQYSVEVVNAVMHESAAGNDYLNWELMIEGGEHHYQRLFFITSLREDLLDMLAKALRAVGVPIDDGEIEVETNMDSVVVTPVLEGRRAIAVVVHDEWNGETRAKVKRLLPASA